MVNILICDNNQEWLNNLTASIQEVVNFPYKLTAFLNAKDLINYISSNDADIVITDIEMPEMDGLELAKKIYNSKKHIQIIFSSIYTEYIQDIFSVKPVFFLVKPFNSEKVKEALDLALDNLDKYNQTISVLSKGKTIKIPTNDIDYVESDKRNVCFHCNGEEILSTIKLDDVQSKLPPSFVRCHKSFLVNMQQIKRISNNEIETLSHRIIPVAKSRFSDTKQIILDFWENEI